MSPAAQQYERALYVPEQRPEGLVRIEAFSWSHLVAVHLAPGLSERPTWGVEHWEINSFSYSIRSDVVVGPAPLEAVALRLIRNGLPVWSGPDLQVGTKGEGESQVIGSADLTNPIRVESGDELRFELSVRAAALSEGELFFALDPMTISLTATVGGG